MKVAALIAKLQEFDPDADVVTPGRDHSYSRISRIQSAEAGNAYGNLYEWHGEEHAGVDETGPWPVVVLE